MSRSIGWPSVPTAQTLTFTRRTARRRYEEPKELFTSVCPSAPLEIWVVLHCTPNLHFSLSIIPGLKRAERPVVWGLGRKEKDFPFAPFPARPALPIVRALYHYRQTCDIFSPCAWVCVCTCDSRTCACVEPVLLWNRLLCLLLCRPFYRTEIRTLVLALVLSSFYCEIRNLLLALVLSPFLLWNEDSCACVARGKTRNKQQWNAITQSFSVFVGFYRELWPLHAGDQHLQSHKSSIREDSGGEVGLPLHEGGVVWLRRLRLLTPQLTNTNHKQNTCAWWTLTPSPTPPRLSPA